MGVEILEFADERYAEREQKALKEERERLAESLRSRGFDESMIQEVLSFKQKDDAAAIAPPYSRPSIRRYGRIVNATTSQPQKYAYSNGELRNLKSGAPLFLADDTGL